MLLGRKIVDSEKRAFLFQKTKQATLFFKSGLLGAIFSTDSMMTNANRYNKANDRVSVIPCAFVTPPLHL